MAKKEKELKQEQPTMEQTVPAMEQQQPQASQQPMEPQGWKDVQISPEMPLSALVQFFNVLNQRLVNVEDNTVIDVNGEKMTLSQFYAKQTEAELKAQRAQQESKAE